MDDSERPATGEPEGGDAPTREGAHVARQEEVPADGDQETLGDEVTRVVESAAELGLGAVIGPFTGGETVSIVGSVASMMEAGVDRLTHLGEHETELDEPDEPDGPDYPSGPEPADSPGDDGRE